MSLKGSQFKEFQEALLSAFPSYNALARMVRFGLNENLDAVTGTGNLDDVVFKLITWAEAEGRVEELANEARKAVPGNLALKAFTDSYLHSAVSNPTAPVPMPVTLPNVSTAPNAGTPSDGKQPIEVFFSYSHKDEKMRETLETHLALLKRQGVIAGWNDRRITAGSEWADQIDEHLKSARVILLLVSPNFVASDYCYDKEMMVAMARHEAGDALVIPIILRPCDWHGAPFGKLQALPKDAKPITDWANRDTAFLDVAQGIRRAIEAKYGKS